MARTDFAEAETSAFDWRNGSSRRSLTLYAAGAILGLGLAGYALFTAKGTVSNALPPEDIALVNGRHVLRSDFILQTQVETGETFQMTTRAQRMKVVGEMLDEELKVQRGLEVDLAAYDPEVRMALVNGVNLQVDADVIAQQPTEADLRAYFAKRPDRYATSGVFRLWDLVAPILPTQPDAVALAKAQAASAALMKGVTPEDAIRTFGLVDTKLLDKQDNFDFGVNARLGPVLYGAAAKLESGQVSVPIKVVDGQRTAGWHVVVVVKRIKSLPVTFEQVKDNVVVDYDKDARDRVERSNLDYLRSQADIHLTPEYAR